VALVAVTDHAVERYRQRVRGSLDPRTEIAARVERALAAGRSEAGERGATLVRDVERPALVYVCMEDRPRGELIVVTLYEAAARRAEPPVTGLPGRGGAAVPRRFTDAMRRRRT
jgi:hypothetical protein